MATPTEAKKYSPVREQRVYSVMNKAVTLYRQLNAMDVKPALEQDDFQGPEAPAHAVLSRLGKALNSIAVGRFEEGVAGLQLAREAGEDLMAPHADVKGVEMEQMPLFFADRSWNLNLSTLRALSEATVEEAKELKFQLNAALVN